MAISTLLNPSLKNAAHLNSTAVYDELTELDNIINTSNILTVYQPIVSLTDGNVIGYEALTRGPVNSPLKSPDKLFAAAQTHNKTWDLELLCRVKAIQRAKNLKTDKFLFINVDPYIFKDEKFKKGFTKEFLSMYDISPTSIIFEITEKTCIEDYRTFKAALDNYVDQGYKIAIDDVGSGYSGLKTLAETKPHYIKIDMDLIRDIDKDTYKQALIECFIKLSNLTNMKLIAEGIETEEELKTLIKLGVYAGQGYFLCHPKENFSDIYEESKRIIINYNVLKNSSSFYYTTSSIGEIVQTHKAFTSDTYCNSIKKYFDSSDATGACIISNDKPVGLIMKHSLDSVLATQYGVAVFTKRPIGLIMDSKPLIVDYYTSVVEVSKEAMHRKPENIYDYIIVTKNNEYHGIVTIKALLDYTTLLKCNYARQLNPLTELPGNSVIQSHITNAIISNKVYCILYLDLDNFKVYNDTYGFENGDKILKHTAKIIEHQTKNISSGNVFIGHIGGDDFVCILEDSKENCKRVCESVLDTFDNDVLSFFNESDKKRGYIEAVDRHGNKDVFSLTSLSIAGIYGHLNVFSSAEELGVLVASLKKKAKKVKGSYYIIDDIS